MSEVLLLAERVDLATKIGESHYREFKSAYEGPPGIKTKRGTREICLDIAKTLVAFANADGGELFVGIEDDGKVAGIPHQDDEVERLKNAYISHVHGDTPLPRPQISLVDYSGKVVLYFSIQKGNDFAYLTSDGKCLKRMDLESVPVGSEKIRAERLEYESRVWDRTIYDSASLEDLDFDLLRELSNQVAYGVTPEKCLQHLGIAEFSPSGMKLKAAALLLLAKDVRKFHPGCYVRIFTISGKERRSGESFNVVKDDIVADNILKLVETAWERMSYALTMHTSMTDHAKFQQSYLYPQIACREALINAIVHRNYAIQGRGIEISIYTDRLEIVSPGRVLSTISLDDIRKLKGAHESRNPLVARVLRETGYVREMGEGIRRIYDVMRSNALAEPELLSDDNDFTVTLFHRSLYDPKVKLWLSNFEDLKLTESQMAVLALGHEGREFSTQDIIDRLGIVDTDQVREILTPLRQLGVVHRTKDHGQAFKFSKKNKVPKRSVPIYIVVTPSEGGLPENSDAVSSDNDEIVPEEEIKLFVGGLNKNSTKDKIIEAFSKVYPVLDLEMPKDRIKGMNNRGYAFLILECSPDDMQGAIEALDQTEIDGRNVSVKQRK
ncbi:MAG: ATP-binding protein [Alcanivorax sp.]|uniref:ATP-binding protein n=1 Tax=Alcanivorax sp. TaxID=1872427 RepID=UPI003DA73A8F